MNVSVAHLIAFDLLLECEPGTHEFDRARWMSAIHDGLHATANRSCPERERFGVIIRRLREQRGWTLADLGRKALMNPRDLVFLERGENVPTLIVILRPAKVLNVETAEVMREVDRSG